MPYRPKSLKIGWTFLNKTQYNSVTGVTYNKESNRKCDPFHI